MQQQVTELRDLMEQQLDEAPGDPNVKDMLDALKTLESEGKRAHSKMQPAVKKFNDALARAWKEKSQSVGNLNALDSFNRKTLGSADLESNRAEGFMPRLGWLAKAAGGIRKLLNSM